MKFLYYDANGTDGSDRSKMSAVYEFGGERVAVPANATDIRAAVIEALSNSPVPVPDPQAVVTREDAIQQVEAADWAKLEADAASADSVAALQAQVAALTGLVKELVTALGYAESTEEK